MARTLNRNSADFPLRLLEYWRAADYDSQYSFLKYYQNMARGYAQNVVTGAKGFLIYHSMGLGKTLLAVAIAIDLVNDYKIIMLTSKSLQENMRGAIHKYVSLRHEHDPNWPLGNMSTDQLNRWINQNFGFVSMNASNMIDQMQRAANLDSGEFDAALEAKLGKIASQRSLNGCCLIVDEAHNLFRAITNGSKNALGVYELVRKSPKCKFFPMSGTPIASDPFELVPCFNMLHGGDLLPPMYKDFKALYVDGNSVRNREKLQNRLFGLISYVGVNSTPGAGIDKLSPINANMPREDQLEVVKVQMDENQYGEYSLAREQEKIEGVTPGKVYRARIQDTVVDRTSPMNKPKSSAASTYRVKSRQYSNFVAPRKYRDEPFDKIPAAEITSPKFVAMLQNINARPNQVGLVYSQFTGPGGLGSFAKFLRAHGWEQVTVVGEDIAPVYSDVIGGTDGTDGADGTGIVGGAEGPATPYISIDAASFASVPPTHGGNDSGANDSGAIIADDIEIVPTHKPTRNFAIISGEADVETREKIRLAIIAAENKRGKNISLILVSSAGAEGIDLKYIRHVHIMEPYWVYGRIRQIITRGARTDSHIGLDPSEQTIKPFIYIAVSPNGELTTDEELYNESLDDAVLVDEFLTLMQEVSIECLANHTKNECPGRCRVCKPTTRHLFTDDYFRDAAADDPCTPPVETRVQAKEIEHNGVKYYYIEDDSPMRVKIFSYDAGLNLYKVIPVSDPRFEPIYHQIKD